VIQSASIDENSSLPWTPPKRTVGQEGHQEKVATRVARLASMLELSTTATFNTPWHAESKRR